jgi:hypothetical protein
MAAAVAAASEHHLVLQEPGLAVAVTAAKRLLAPVAQLTAAAVAVVVAAPETWSAVLAVQELLLFAMPCPQLQLPTSTPQMTPVRILTTSHQQPH